MNFIKKAAAAVVSAALVVPIAGSMPSSAPIDAASTVTVSPYSKFDINGGKFEGWGTSLCWWANRVGYSDTLAQKTADVFYGDDGLRLNIARFNIGGGDNPSHTHITRTDSNMPGYTKYQNGQVTYDWSADFNQRNVLLRCIKACGDDMIVEMFSNSPPYYMCKSGCSTGNTNPGANNLKDDQYTAFAEYLAEVCYHYKTEWGVDIQSIDPMNEPYTNYWGANSPKQEGCHFDQGNSESTIITELQKSMKARGMGDVILSASDETSIDTQIDSFNKLSSGAKSAISRIDTHTYGGSRRNDLKNLAIANGKNLWMSEVDSGATAGQDAGQMGSGLWLADRINADMNGLNSSAWILWQVIDNHISSVGYNGNKDKGMVNVNGGFWGVAVADHDKNEIVLTKKYYTFGQFTRYIRPGMTMLKSSGNNLIGFDEEKGQLVIVAVNDTASAAQTTYDLSQFTKVGSFAKGIRTSNTESWKDIGNTAISGGKLSVSLAPNSVTTFIIDGVSGKMSLEDKINVTSDMVTGSDPWKSDASHNSTKLFDGNNATYFDGLGNGWVQVDLGKVYDLSAIGYCPRSGFEYRCPEGKFSVSEDGVNWSDLYTIKSKPFFGMNYVAQFSGETSARYVRYQTPTGAPTSSDNPDGSYCCNMAEIELYGKPSPKGQYSKIKPVSIDGSTPYQSSANNADKAFDGSNASFFDGVGDGWVTADLGAVYSIDAIGYCPRKSFEYRCVDGRFMVSTDGENWTEAYTIDAVPGFKMNFADLSDKELKARYVKYEVPSGAPKNSMNPDNIYNANIAEIELYGELLEVPGDVDDNGELAVNDLVDLEKYLLGCGKLTNWKAGDLNSDGKINTFDLIEMRELLSK